MCRWSGMSWYACIAVLVCVVLALAACNGPVPIPPVGRTATPSPIATVPRLEPPPPSTLLPEQNTPTFSPTRTQLPVSPQPTPVSTPDIDLEDLSLFESALKPNFAGDVEDVPDATRYFIQVMLDPDDPSSFTGVQRVRYTNTEDVSLDAIYFRLYPNLPGYGGSMTVDKVMLDGAPVETVLEAANSALRVPLDPTLAPGEMADLTLWFRESLPTDTSAGYGLFAYADDVYALAGFYPTIPVYDDEGWNVEVAPPYGDATFTDVAFYQVQLTVPEALTVTGCAPGSPSAGRCVTFTWP
jgi:hypothetical protein